MDIIMHFIIMIIMIIEYICIIFVFVLFFETVC